MWQEGFCNVGEGSGEMLSVETKGYVLLSTDGAEYKVTVVP